MPRHVLLGLTLLSLTVAPSVARAQGQPWCVPGTQVCAQSDGKGGVRAGGAGQAQAGPGGASASATGHANAGASGNAHGEGQHQGGQGGYVAPPRYSAPTRFGSGAVFCGTGKAGVFSGIKGGGCLAVSFRWEPIFFEMETQVLYGGVRESVDWVFPLSFVIPLTSQRSLYEGLQLRVGGSPVGATFAGEENGGSYVRFGLHAGVSYEWDVGDLAWRVIDARTFLDFGTKREVDDRGNFLDFGVQLATGIVL